MSFSVSIKNIAKTTVKYITEKCTFYRIVDDRKEKIHCFVVNSSEGNVYLPLALWNTFYETFPFIQKTKVRCKFLTKLYTPETDPKNRNRDQQKVYGEIISILKEKHSCFANLPTGYGKTTLGVKVAIDTNGKTLCLCHSDVVKRQWVDTFHRHTNGKATIVKGDKLKDGYDFYVIGIRKMANMSRNAFSDITLVIIDESHIATKTAFSKALFKVQPTYLLGLSATPDRPDKLHKCFPVFFGETVMRKEVKDFIVVKYKTHHRLNAYFRQIRYDMRLDWTKMMTEISNNVHRIHDITQLACSHKQHKIMILSNRVAQSHGIYNGIFNNENECALLVGRTRTYDVNIRCLVAGVKKAGVGFDDPTRTMLIMASDCKDVRQYEGRIRNTNNVIYDVVDSDAPGYKTLENHWNKRRRWYLSRGGTIQYGYSDLSFNDDIHYWSLTPESKKRLVMVFFVLKSLPKGVRRIIAAYTDLRYTLRYEIDVRNSHNHGYTRLARKMK